LPYSAAAPCATCSASCDFTVNLSHLIAIVLSYSHQIRARRCFCSCFFCFCFCFSFRPSEICFFSVLAFAFAVALLGQFKKKLASQP
jgi:hypothetical protein